MDLFSDTNPSGIKIIDLPDAEVIYYANFFSLEQATRLYQTLVEETPWQQDNIKVFGKTYQQPRLTSFYADTGKSYTYSGIKMMANPWTQCLQEIKARVETIAGQSYNSVLLNLYRDGKDSNGWHSDDEKGLGINPHIASVTFGAKRTFHLRAKSDKKVKRSLQLEHGSLLLMGKATQHTWQHQIPKSNKSLGPRINLTFRTII